MDLAYSSVNCRPYELHTYISSPWPPISMGVTQRGSDECCIHRGLCYSWGMLILGNLRFIEGLLASLPIPFSRKTLLWTVSWSPLGRGWRLYLGTIGECFWGGKSGKKSALRGKGYTISDSQGYLLCSHPLKDNLRWSKRQENCFPTKYSEQLSDLKIVNSEC